MSAPHHDEVHVALVAERADKLRVLGVLAVFGQAAQAGGPTVERLGAPEIFQFVDVERLGVSGAACC